MADFEQAVKDIVARLNANIPTALGSPVFVKFPNAPGENPNNAPWIRLSIVPTARNNVTASNAPWIREFGLIALDVFTPVGSGLNANLGVISQLITTFENKEFGVVKCTSAGRVKIEDEPWLGYQLNISFNTEGVTP